MPFFYAVIRSKNKHKGLYTLTAMDGTRLTRYEQIEKEIHEFYTKLVGSRAQRINGIDINAVRRGKSLPREKALELISPVSEKEVWDAIQGIGNNKAPGIDGYNSLFFKKAWKIIGRDVIDAVLEFFRTSKMYRAVNCSLITLIPKTSEAKTVKDMRPIS